MEPLRIPQEQKGRKIHLLMTDVVMSNMDGNELSEKLKPSRPRMKVLFTSGYPDDEIPKHQVLEGEMNFLQKPASAAALTQRVYQILRMR